MTDDEKRSTAWHEAGHALVSHALPNADPVHKVSIVSRGRALGYTLTLPTEDRFLVTRSELIDAVWGQAPPETARHALQVYVSQLRKAIPDGAERIRRFARDLVNYARPSGSEVEDLAINELLDQALSFCEHVLEGAHARVRCAARNCSSARPAGTTTRTRTSRPWS